MIVNTHSDENGELTAKDLNGRGDWMHTVLTREQTELRDRIHASFDIEMAKIKQAGGCWCSSLEPVEPPIEF